MPEGTVFYNNDSRLGGEDKNSPNKARKLLKAQCKLCKEEAN